jgi:hypothetical protein
MIPEPKFDSGQTVKGRAYGEFAIVGRMWSDVMGEWVYGCFQMRGDERAPGELRLVESTFE